MYMDKPIHFITYGNNKFAQAKTRILKEAELFEEFKTIKGYGPEDLPREFTKKYSKILNMPRGGGYWIWKPIIIRDKISEMKDGEYLVYADAGCELNIEGKTRFFEYIEMLNKSDYGLISFQMDGTNGAGGYHPEKEFTTRQIFDYFKIGMDDQILDSGQHLATVLIMKKNTHLIGILDKYNKVIEDNCLLFTDHYNRVNQLPDFIDNRHDQSILSIISKLYNSIVVHGDETWMQPFGKGESLKYPFWATRSKV